MKPAAAAAPADVQRRREPTPVAAGTPRFAGLELALSKF